MANKTLIIAILNKAYMEQIGMLDLFLQSFREGEGTRFLIKHLLFVAVDQTSFNQCCTLGLNCYELVTEGVDFSEEVFNAFSEEVFYMSDDFIEMMWRRTLFLGDVLKRRYSFIFTVSKIMPHKSSLNFLNANDLTKTKHVYFKKMQKHFCSISNYFHTCYQDVDDIWSRNLFTKLNQEGEDLQMSSYVYNGRPFDGSDFFNTSFYFVTPNNKTTALFDEWYASKHNFTHMNDQEELLKMKRAGVFRRLGLKVRYLDTTCFTGFCQKSKDFGRVTQNCCVSVKAKFTNLTAVLEAWTSNNGTSNATWPMLAYEAGNVNYEMNCLITKQGHDESEHVVPRPPRPLLDLCTTAVRRRDRLGGKILVLRLHSQFLIGRILLGGGGVPLGLGLRVGGSTRRRQSSRHRPRRE
ncbi:hypothetical protein BHE74_00022099 [Ensete ventricosum]|nr:hypothetical protein GW17_00002030 [Ensete ventricosum]RWW70235.1 hypothetical protein BHE74_00022099 [Ensete ventricosum]RZR85244.1 hypothetical protein BHM03_00012206 [Ensete ventricosum]